MKKYNPRNISIYLYLRNNEQNNNNLSITIDQLMNMFLLLRFNHYYFIFRRAFG